jgi:phospholipase C
VFPYYRLRLRARRQRWLAAAVTTSQIEKGSYFMSTTDRRQFLQLMGAGALASLKANIVKALDTPANNRTGTIKDVEHIVILMQENRPFDHHFGTLRGVRGFNDPRAVSIHLPLQNGTGTTPASVFLQPAGAAHVAAGFAVPPELRRFGWPGGWSGGDPA